MEVVSYIMVKRLKKTWNKTLVFRVFWLCIMLQKGVGQTEDKDLAPDRTGRAD